MIALIVLQDVCTVQLTKGKNALVDASDWHGLSGRPFHYKTVRHHRYAATTIKDDFGRSREVAMHRLLTGASRGMHVDHRNGDGTDNRRSNIRVCTPAQNIRNLGKPYGESRFKGVDYHVYNKKKKRWRARIQDANGKRIELGHFDTQEEAARAYDVAAAIHHGDFAKTNAQILGDY